MTGDEAYERALREADEIGPEDLQAASEFLSRLPRRWDPDGFAAAVPWDQVSDAALEDVVRAVAVEQRIRSYVRLLSIGSARQVERRLDCLADPDWCAQFPRAAELWRVAVDRYNNRAPEATS